MRTITIQITPQRQKKIRDLLSRATRRPWKKANPYFDGCKVVKGDKRGTHNQGQYRTEICWTPGLWKEDEDRANADLIFEAVMLVDEIFAEGKPNEKGS